MRWAEKKKSGGRVTGDEGNAAATDRAPSVTCGMGGGERCDAARTSAERSAGEREEGDRRARARELGDGVRRREAGAAAARAARADRDERRAARAACARCWRGARGGKRRRPAARASAASDVSSQQRQRRTSPSLPLMPHLTPHNDASALLLMTHAPARCCRRSLSAGWPLRCAGREHHVCAARRHATLGAPAPPLSRSAAAPARAWLLVAVPSSGTQT